MPSLPRLIRPTYMTDVNRCTGPPDPAAASQSEVTIGDLSLSLVWRELLSCHGIVDVASMDVLRQTPETHEYLWALVPPPDGWAPIPAGAYNVAAQLLAVEADVDGHPPLDPACTCPTACGSHCARPGSDTQTPAVGRRSPSPSSGLTRGTDVIVCAHPRSERPRRRVVAASHGGPRHSRDRAMHVPVRAHRARSPQADLRKDVNAQSPDLAETCSRHMIT